LSNSFFVILGDVWQALVDLSQKYSSNAQQNSEDVEDKEPPQVFTFLIERFE
jgi:hypothetical protein